MLKKNISPEKKSMMFVDGDIRFADDCERIVKEDVDSFGKIVILFNNAGVIYIDRTVVETSAQGWQETLDVNLKGTYLMSRFTIPKMIESGGGSIINNASIIGLGGCGCGCVLNV